MSTRISLGRSRLGGLARSLAVLGLAVAGAACSSAEEGRTRKGPPDGSTSLDLCAESFSGSPVLRRLNAREFNATLNAVFPQVAGSWTSSLSADPISHYNYDNEADRLLVSRQKAREIDETAAALASAVSGSALAEILPCATAADRACADTFVETYGKRLFRRPVRDDEKEKLLAFFDQAASKVSFPEAIGWLTRALVHSPHTVYRSEIGALAGDERRLTQHEVAAALSYTFGGVPPNDQLLARADAGELDSPEVLVNVAREFMTTASGRENLHYLFGAWLGYPRVTTMTKANEGVSEQFAALRNDMREETRRFLDLVVLDGGGGLDELLTSRQTTPSVALASFYGFPAPAGDYQPVERPETGGIGVLAQGSILASKALPTGSSPTQRGLLVMENFLCRNPPEVPPDVPDLAQPTEGPVTTRERYETLHATGACKNCHRQFDPIGFGFEHFDEVGRYRQDEGGLTIDASGEVPGSFSFSGQAELAQLLAQELEVQACVSARVKAYAFGMEEACLGESEREAFMSGAIGFVDYIASLAAEPHFRTRRAQ